MASNIFHKPTSTINGLSLYYAGDVAIIVMDRGENRINEEFVTAFDQLLDHVEKNESCKGLITTGKGKFYGNGLDLHKFISMPEAEVAVVILTFVKLLKRLLMFPVPTLAAINGHAFAGGCLFALAHDLRTMQLDKGWICMNEVFLNLKLGKLSLKVCEKKLGSGPNFSDALVLGKRFTAKEAFKVGIVHAIQPENLLISESIHVLKHFSGKGYFRDSLVMMKGDVYREILDVYEEDDVDKQIEDAKRGIIPLSSKL